MSEAQVYITGAIHWDGSSSIPTSIRTQVTQFTQLKIAIPRKGMRTADLQMNLLNSELAPVYAIDQFSTYSNFLYVKWRGHVVFWGPILTKETDFEARTLTLHAKDRCACLEKIHWHLGDTALNAPKGTGNLPVNAAGVSLCFHGYNDHLFPGYIPLGIAMGSNSHIDLGHTMGIERSQMIWRTLQDMGDRTDGPLFELVPQDVSSTNFAVCNTFGQERTDRSATVKFHYNTGYNNVRNIRATTGGGVLSNATIVTANKHWRDTTYYQPTGQMYGLWEDWEQVDWDVDDNDYSGAVAALEAIGDATLDSYGRPLVSLEVTLRRDDQIQNASHQFFWTEDFNVADLVEIQGAQGPESFSGTYLIDGVRLEQESDNSGEMRQGIDVIPHVPTGLYTYSHDPARIHTFDTTGSG